MADIRVASTEAAQGRRVFTVGTTLADFVPGTVTSIPAMPSQSW